ncbi:MAG: M42 family metallopeptidase [Oscillospiraceae bacterium]|nr:M42 family metallopeptidase [Oscillospiraceae bacterium]
MLNLIKALCALPGVSSFEGPVRDYIRARITPFADDVRVDAMGNLIAFKRGKRPAGNTLLLAAHMDEVGLIIRELCEDGCLKFETVGGIDRRVLIGKRVRVGAAGIAGVIGLKAYHLVSAEEEKTVPRLEQFYIDIGCTNKAEAEALVSPGDYAAFDSDAVEFGDGLLKAKALDDRIGCAVMMRLMEQPLEMDCTFAFTVQEEVGTRGAFGAAFSVTPKIALVLETTTAADLPDMQGHKRVCVPGGGPVVPFMDGGSVADRGLYELLRTLARAHDIPWQTKHYIAGGNDAAAIQRTKDGVRTAVLSAAVRYLHAPASVASVRDFDPMLRLARHFIAAVAEKEETEWN